MSHGRAVENFRMSHNSAAIGDNLPSRRLCIASIAFNACHGKSSWDSESASRAILRDGTAPSIMNRQRRRSNDGRLGGGGQLCRSFLQEDLVDELFLGLSSVPLRDGIPAFRAGSAARFKVTERKSYSNGSVGLRYEGMRTKTSR
jgi:dihydrofolate reductase